MAWADILLVWLPIIAIGTFVVIVGVTRWKEGGSLKNAIFKNLPHLVLIFSIFAFIMIASNTYLTLTDIPDNYGSMDNIFSDIEFLGQRLDVLLLGFGIPVGLFQEPWHLFTLFLAPIAIVFMLFYSISLEVFEDIFQKSPWFSKSFSVALTLMLFPVGGFIPLIYIISIMGSFFIIYWGLVGALFLMANFAKRKFYNPSVNNLFYDRNKAEKSEIAIHENKQKNIKEALKIINKSLNELVTLEKDVSNKNLKDSDKVANVQTKLRYMNHKLERYITNLGLGSERIKLLFSAYKKTIGGISPDTTTVGQAIKTIQNYITFLKQYETSLYELQNEEQKTIETKNLQMMQQDQEERINFSK